MRSTAASLVLLSILCASAASQREPLWDAPIEARDLWLTDAVAKGKRVFVSGSEEINAVDNIDRAILAAHNSKTGELLWVAPGDPATGHVGGASWQSTLGDLVLAKKAIVASGWREVFGPGWEGSVRAHDQKTGTLLWSKQFPGSAFTKVAVKGKTVFIATTMDYGTQTPSIRVTAYDLMTGSERWSETHGPLDEDPQVEAMAASGRYVAIAGFQKKPGEPSKSDPFVRVYHAKTGELLWDDVLDEGDGFDLALAVAIKGKRLFVGGTRTPAGGDRDGLLVAYHLKKGQQLWSHSVAVEGNQVIYALVSSGSRLTTLTLDDAADGWLLRAHKSKNGVVRWDEPIDVDSTFISNSFAAKGRRVVVGLDQGTFAFDAKTGKPKWDAEASGFSAAISGKRAFVAGLGGTRAFLVK